MRPQVTQNYENLHVIVGVLWVEFEVFGQQVLIAHWHHNLGVEQHFFKLFKCEYRLESQNHLFEPCDACLLVLALANHIQHVFAALYKRAI